MSQAYVPGPMPVDREKWFLQLNLSNFINTYHQYRDLERIGAGRKILVVGPGQGLDTAVLRWRGFDVTTFDLDETFKPDVVGSVHSMSSFHDSQFDVVIASHVLEHLPASFFDAALLEISRVGRFALIYLPVAGRHGMLRFVAGVRDIEFSILWDLFNYLHKPSGETPDFCERQHFWEVGRRGFRRRDIRSRLQKHFEIITDYRNRDWLPSYNFVLRSRYADAAARPAL
jgi:predicted SAM-dependent methyltransferase